VEAQSYGPKAYKPYILMRVAETFPGSTAAGTTITATPATVTQTHAATPLARPAMVNAPTQPVPPGSQLVQLRVSNAEPHRVFCLSWIKATYEPSPGKSIEQNIMYKQYLASMHRIGRKEVISSQNYALCIRTLFGGSSTGPNIKTVNDKLESHYTGIQVRAQPLPLKLTPAQAAAAQEARRAEAANQGIMVQEEPHAKGEEKFVWKPYSRSREEDESIVRYMKDEEKIQMAEEDFDRPKHTSLLDEKHFCCDNCEYKTLKKSHMKIHVKSVHEKVTYACDQCAYKATLKENIKKHIKSVHEKVTYACWQCDYKATLKENLKRHTKSVHEKGKLKIPLKSVSYSCDNCVFKSTQKGNLTKHIKSFHDIKAIYSCDKCEFKTRWQSNLIRHTKSVHEKVK